MRTGEVFALTWDDIDLVERKIKIYKTLYSKIKDEKGRWFLGTTKTEGSVREVYICDTLLKSLLNYKKYQENNKKKYKAKYHKYYLEQVKNKYGKVVEFRIIELKHKSKNRQNIDLVFVNKDGLFSGTDVIRYPFKVIRKELGIQNCRFYDLRGSFATKTLRSGVEIKDVAEILGHSRIETTENYYILSSKENKKVATELLEKQMQSKIIDNVINSKS